MADFDEWGGWSGGFDAGSYDPVDYSFGTPSFDYGGFSSTLQDPTADFQMPQFSQAGDVGPQQSGGGFLGGLGNFFSQPQNLLGLAGAGAGLFGTLMGGGQGPTQQPVLGTAQRAALEQSNAALAPFAQGQTPMQLQQQALLNALATGQGLPPGYAALIEQAFQPQLGNLYTQATQAGRARGFHDAPATSPPGGAILGPGLANIQGQQAAAKLGLMQSLPNLFTPAITAQSGAAANQAQNLFNTAQLGTGRTQTQPLAPQIGQAVGAGLQGLGQSIGQQQQQKQMDDWLRQMQASISLSGQR